MFGKRDHLLLRTILLLLSVVHDTPYTYVVT